MNTFGSQYKRQYVSLLARPNPLKMANNPTSFLPADLDLLAQLVENEKCALILGPLASCGADGRPLRHALANEIADEFFKKTGRRLPDEDDLSLVCTAFMQLPNMARTSLEIIVRDFYKRNPEPSPLLKVAAQLPFRIIFTAAHDENLQTAFLQQRKRQERSGFYRFSKTQLDDYDHTPEGQSYIYQLFGRTADKPDGSIVLTIADQLAFMDSIQGPGKETHLPAGLRRAMQECEAMLFLGFDFENWFLKVLFHILKFSEKAKFVFGLPEGRSAMMDGATAEFFSHQYKFSFLADRPLELLEGLRQRIDSGTTSAAPSESELRPLLFLHAQNEKDEAILDRIDKQLAAAKRTHGLRSGSIHDFEAGDTTVLHLKRVASASVIVVLLSADFVADDALISLAEKALARQSSSVVVAAVYAREVLGATDLFKNKAPVFPAETVPLSLMPEDVGAKMVAEMLVKLIETLPKP